MQTGSRRCGKSINDKEHTMWNEPGGRVRAITDDEVNHYRKHGWVKLERFFPLTTVAGLLERAKARMGERPRSIDRTDPRLRMPDEYGWYSRWDGCSHVDGWIREVSHSRELAGVAGRLVGGPVRFYFDHVFVKLPAAQQGTETPWHQDLPHHPLDRQGALTIWAPLVACPPEMGSMRFLSGSHKAGLFGRYLNRRDGVHLLQEHPHLMQEHELSPPLDLMPGDVTVHNLAVVHHAPSNRTDQPRWVYACQWLPALARYTGAPNHRTDGHGLAIDQPFDHPRFPLIGP
jgi:hypothetical protein